MTGLNPVTLGGTPDPQAPVATTEAAMRATSNVIKPILDACLEVKQSVGECLMRRIQIAVRTTPDIRKAYMGVIGSADMDELIRMESESVQYGMSLKPKPDAMARMRFEKWIDIALQNTREQRPGIDLNDAVYFMGQLDAGADLFDLERQLEFAIEKNKKEVQAQSEKMIQLQGQTNMQNEQMKAQAELEKIKAQAVADISEEQVRGEIKNLILTKEQNNEWLRELRLAAEAEEGITVGGTKK